MVVSKYYFISPIPVSGKKVLEDFAQFIQSLFVNNKKIENPNFPDAGIMIQVQNSKTTAKTVLSRVWVYWLDGNELTILRTDNRGCLFTRPSDRERKNPWEYTQIFKPKIGSNVGIFFSRGAKPVPDAELTSNKSVFQQKTIASEIILSDVVVELTAPTDLSIWPLLWELPVDNHASQAPDSQPDYLTANLSQGSNLWNDQNQFILEQNHQSPLAPNEVIHNGKTINIRPRERGLLIEGRIDSRVTGVTIKMLRDDETVIPLREGINRAAATRNEIACSTSQIDIDNKKTFQAHVFFENSAREFGPIQIIITSVGITPPIIGAFLVHLSGFQIALVDDHTTNVNGQERGSILREADEQVIIDFIKSPQNTKNDLKAQARARRMISYQLANQNRLLDDAQPAGEHNLPVVKPQMPLWMAELQIVGITPQQLEDLMSRRYYDVGFTRPHDFPITLTLELRWRLSISWDGPDANSPQFPNINRANQTHRYSQQFPIVPETQIIKLHFGTRGQFVNVNNQDLVLDANNAVPDAFESLPQQISFPVTNRRLPKVIVQNQMRHWGRQNVSTQKNSLLIEFQPRIVNEQNQEIIRGGDGILELQTAIVNGKKIDSGLVPNQENNLVSAPGNEPLIRLPSFRVKGLNPAPSDQINELIERLVENYYNLHRTLARIQLLSLACWQEMARRIIQYESGGLDNGEYRGGQFYNGRLTNRPRYDNYYYGVELDMPNFGPPHGYGFGQLDFIFGRGANPDEVWSFFHNIESAVNLMMGQKSIAAYDLINDHLPNPLDQRIRAIYQREIVREYNGGSEFDWDNNENTWKIAPGLHKWKNENNHDEGPNDSLSYPNTILGTNVTYWNGNGANAQFPWPITFEADNYGPLT